ncbi:MAG: 1-acyl-sn-glycerol-3-phosphate acyltransferase [Verrucomicrobiota bacterium]
MKDNLYTRLYLWLIARRRSVLAVTALVMVAAGWFSTRIDLQEDILDMLPRNDRQVDDYRYALGKFRQIDRVYLDIGIDRDDAETLAQAADEVHSWFATNENFVRITYRVEMSGQGKVIEFLTGALPNLFTAADAEALQAKLEPTEVRQYLAVMRRKLAGPEGLVLKDVVAADPIGMSALVVAKVLPLQTGFGDAQVVEGRITSGDGRHVLLLAEPKFASSDSKASGALVRAMEQVASEVEQRFPGVHVAITGGHRMAVDNASIIRGDATRCIAIGSAGMIVLCFVAYRRRWLAPISFIPSLFGTLMAGVGLMLWQKHLSAIATGFASIAVGITVDYAIHIIYHLDDTSSRDHREIGRHLSRLVFPVALGVITTIAAFLVMMTSPLHGYQQLGLLGAVGVVFSSAFALFILPLLIPVAKQAGQPPLWLTTVWEKYFRWESRRRVWLILGLLVTTIVMTFGAKRLKFEGDITRLNGIKAATRQDDDLIQKTWGGALGMTMIVARGETPAAALTQNDRVFAALRQETNVAAVYSLASVCPAPEAQQVNLQRWREFWTPARRAGLRAGLEKIGGEMGFRADAFDRFWQSVAGERPLLTLDMFRGTPLESALNERVALGTNDHAISTLVKLKNRDLAGELRAALPDTIVLDSKGLADHIAGLARVGLERFALWSTVFVGGLLFLSMASVELVVMTLLPIAIGLMWTFGLMGWLGLPIDLMNSIFVIFVIGVSEDYAVFMVTSKLDEWRGRPGMTAVNSASVLISALTTIFGFGVMVIANHPVLFSMGVTVLIGMGFAFLATLVVVPIGMDILLFKPQPRGAPRWWHVLGTVWVVLHLGGSQVFLYYVLRPILKVISPKTADDRLRRATRWMARGVVKGMPFGKLEFQNISAETFAKPCIVISNHQSAVDVMLMVSLPGDVRQTAKKRVFDAPMLGMGCKILGHVMVEPNDPQKTLQRCRETLASGASVHFYPEGTRSVDGYVQRFHRGAFELAVELKQDILPIVLCDSNVAMPRDWYWIEPFHTTVRALSRITPQNFDYAQGVVALMKHCETVVRAALQEQLDAVNTPKVVRRKVERLYRYQGIYVEQFVKWKMKLDPFFLKLDSVVPRQAQVLDLGCGYGMATHWLAAFTDTRTFWGVDYDEEKIRVAQRSAAEISRIKFTQGDLLECELPPGDAALLLDVLHYWTADKQLLILNKVRQALRPGGRLILRDGARAETSEHRNIHRWEVFATQLGMNRTKEGLHFQTLAEMETMLKRAGFAHWEIQPGAGNDSNVMLVAFV